MLFYLHGEEAVLIFGILILLVYAFFFGFVILGLVIIYKVFKKSKNKIQVLNLTENKDTNL